MDIYEKAKAYNDAIRKADDIRKGNCETPFVYSQGLFEYLFPLEESEDERIRKELLGFLRNIPNSNYTCEEMALWLEKQGQVKESEIPQPIKETSKENDNSLTKKVWSEEDIRNIQDIDSILFYDKDLPEETCIRLRNWLKSLKPNKDMVEALRTEYEKGRADTLSEMKSSWSEEDEKTLNEIFSVAARASLRKSTLFGKSYDYIKWQNWLKSLRDRVQPQQKWSEYDERMIDNIIFELEENQENISGVGYKIDWLKQLKQRIGG